MCVGRIKVLLERLEANGGGGGGTGEGEAVAIAAARRREPGGDWFRVDEKYKTRNSEMLRWGVYERASLSADPKHPVAGANADNEAAQLLTRGGGLDRLGIGCGGRGEQAVLFTFGPVNGYKIYG